MACTRAQSARKSKRQLSKDQGKRSRGITSPRETSLRKPTRRRQQPSPDRTRQSQTHASPVDKTHPEQLQAPPTTTQRRGRKRSIEALEDVRPQKRQRASNRNPNATGETVGELLLPSAPQQITSIQFWASQGKWPPDYQRRNSNMDRVLAQRRSSSRKRSSSPSSTVSDLNRREEKSAPYRDARYRKILETKGSFMDKSKLDLADKSKILCRTLLENDQTVPQDSLFRDDIFESTCRRVEDRNEARVLRDITPLVVPPAEILAIYGDARLDCLVESINEGWNNSIPVIGTRPQPDYSAGFKREAFTEDQLNKLSPFIGDWINGDLSYFMGAYNMYFPFLTCEVKCGAAALDVADRQNAHSMTIAARAVVELFRLVGRESELHRQILGFSVSHDHCSVRIYGHYPVVGENDTKYYRHPIRKFDITELDGREKWTAYKFTKNVYTLWMPNHFEMLCSAIDQLSPGYDLDAPPLSEKSGLSQALSSCQLPDSDVDSGAEVPATPDTSFTEQGAPKRRRRKADG